MFKSAVFLQVEWAGRRMKLRKNRREGTEMGFIFYVGLEFTTDSKNTRERQPGPLHAGTSITIRLANQLTSEV